MQRLSVSAKIGTFNGKRLGMFVGCTDNRDGKQRFAKRKSSKRLRKLLDKFVRKEWPTHDE